MARRAGPRCLGVAVTAETGDGVYPAIHAVAGQVIAPMGHAAVVFGLVPDRRLELDRRGVTVVAVAGLMADTAKRFVAVGRLSVIVGPVSVVVEAFVGDMLSAGLVAVGADRPAFAQLSFRGVLHWEGVAAFKGGAGRQDGHREGEKEQGTPLSLCHHMSLLKKILCTYYRSKTKLTTKSPLRSCSKKGSEL